MGPVLWPEESRYIPAFDGVRAIAVLLVIWRHTVPLFGMGRLPPEYLGPVSVYARAGWVGVDVFFTLSGFLITGILLRTLGEPGYFRSFYIRRFLRIFPLYYGLITLVILSRVLGGGELVDPAWSYYTYLSNFFVGRSPRDDVALDISWSLSVEEQFYLVWPAFVAVVGSRGMRPLLGAIVAICLLGPVVRWGVFDPATSAAYFDTWSRIDSLAIGALGATLWQARVEWAVRGARLLAVPATVGLLVLVWMLGTGAIGPRSLEFLVPGLSAIALGVTVVLLALASGGLPRVAAVLGSAPFAHVGRVSYGVYLLHPIVLGLWMRLWPRLPLPPAAESRPVALLLYILPPLVSVGVATLVFRTIEAPLLAQKDRLAPYAGLSPRSAPSAGVDEPRAPKSPGHGNLIE
ncbi:MAG: acyltransferase [Myxococcota bacterium]